MEKAIAEIKSCHAVATTDVTGQGNNKARVDDMQVRRLFLTGWRPLFLPLFVTVLFNS